MQYVKIAKNLKNNEVSTIDMMPTKKKSGKMLEKTMKSEKIGTNFRKNKKPIKIPEKTDEKTKNEEKQRKNSKNRRKIMKN